MNKAPILFTNKNRTERIQSAQSVDYDLIIIGGGITGAGIALDGSLRGLKVLLVEKNDFASGTSSKSTKLIHGGLRYLKQFEFGLVRETGLERAIAHKNAVHLVHPENMLLPIVKNGSFNAFTASLAISVYDLLAKVEKDQRKQKLSKQDVISTEPLLKKEGLKSGILYSEYRTDDARLTIELIKSANRNGADIFNYLEVENFVYSGNKTSGIIAIDHANGKKIKLKGKSIVNAAGPWVDKLRIVDSPKTETNIQLSKGVHIVIDREKLNINQSVYFDAFDNRMIFAIPRGNIVYIGTTDTFYYDDKDAIHCTESDINYLLNATNHMFDIPTLNINDVKSTWAGLRPLIRKKGKSASELSRKDEIFVSDSGLITIAGGKLTGFRKMAERVVDLVLEKQNKDCVPCQTEEYKIHGNPFEDYDEYEAFQKSLANRYPDFDAIELEYLSDTFGKDCLEIIETAESSKDRLLINQLDYAINFESAFLPIDFIERRTGWLYFSPEKVRKYLSFIVTYFAKAFSRDQAWIDRNLNYCEKIYSENTLADFKS
ncbi:MAG: glycerol-3-phosphate dehydrogenase/oxidase [Saprospiraceae bacterium]|nr:glycerol-3-phosphate dehydrogenase/oxidase [Bacteroidia bacterium]NNE14767.1 glycerol-3-phosphate dehydrogenase/oxidase [Saprospiraceae bacterium]NNL93196.1 glycerol-3-phosphate dehydrogenase/oxidase [Saprospiraceae bacterium]